MQHEQISDPREAAGHLLLWLQRCGAVMEIDAHGDLQADLNPIDFSRVHASVTPAVLAGVVLSLASQLKAIMRADRTAH